MASIMLGYIFYDLTHYYLHHAPPSMLFFASLKTHHLYHHYKNSNSNYGITMPIFDWIMGTYDGTMLSQKDKRQKNKRKVCGNKVTEV